MPGPSDNSPLRRDPLHAVRVVRRRTRLIVYPLIALIVPVDHFVIGTPWLTTIAMTIGGGYAIGTVAIEFIWFYFFKLRKEAAYPTMLAMELGSTQDFRQACETAVRLVADLLRAEMVVLAWRNCEDGSLTTVTTHGISPADVAEATPLCWSQQTVRQAIDERKVVVASASENRGLRFGFGGRSRVAYVPLVSLDQVVGILALVGGRKASDLGDKTLLTPIGLAIGLTLQDLYHTMELRRRTNEYIDTTNLTGDVIVRLDKHGNWAFLNDAACKFYGKPREGLLGTDSSACVHPEDRERTAQAIRETRARNELTTGFVNRQITPMGTRVVEWNGYPLFDEEGEYAGIQITGRDITERKQMEEEQERLRAELEMRAISDSLTGLYNHGHFYQRLGEEIERTRRYGRGFTVVIMDVDNFKHYNDSRGHQAGDVALCLVGDCIRRAMRRSDFAFRYGGDEFAAILLHADSSRAQAIIKRMNRCIARRLRETDDPAAGWLGLSAGVASFPNDAATADELVRVADAALYKAKREVRARSTAIAVNVP